jgi:uncharacterized protein
MSIAMSAGNVQTESQASVAAARTVTAQGRLREKAVAEGDRFMAIAMHLWPIAFCIVGPFGLGLPLVLWLARRDHSSFLDDHGREVMNVQLSTPLMLLITLPTIVGPLVVAIAFIVNCIRGAVAAGQGEYFRYPATIRFIP